jgi:hypothetical protein
MSCAAAEGKDMIKNHFGRQSQDIESLSISVDLNICLALETDSRNLIEEAHQFIWFSRSCARKLIQEVFKKKMVNQRSSGETVHRCGNLIFNHDYTIDMSCGAAERKDMNKNHISRQCQDVECFYYLIHGTICQESRNCSVGNE